MVLLEFIVSGVFAIVFTLSSGLLFRSRFGHNVPLTVVTGVISLILAVVAVYQLAVVGLDFFGFRLEREPPTHAGQPDEAVPDDKPSMRQTPAVRAPDPAAVELTYWNSISGSTSIRQFQLYLRRYPNGQFADLAQSRIDELEEAAAARQRSTPVEVPTAGPPPPAQVRTPATQCIMFNGEKHCD